MTLTALRVANFKAFASSQRMPLSPITLILGANSAGKSSLIHALALAHHAAEAGDLDAHRTTIGGEAIDLGGFRQYVYRRDPHRQMELAFELDVRRLPGRAFDLLRSARELLVEVGVGWGPVYQPVGAETSHAGAVVQRYALSADGAPILAMSVRQPGILRLDRLEHGHPVFRELLRALLTFATTTETVNDDELSDLSEILDALVPGISARAASFLPRLHDEDIGRGESSDAVFPVSRGRRQEDLARAARLFVPTALRDLLNGIADAIQTELGRLRYLGPLRSYPPRHLAFAQHHDSHRFAGGGFAWDVVRERKDVRTRVNTWLGDPARLSSPYELVVRDLLPASFVSNHLPVEIDASLQDLARATLLQLHGADASEFVDQAAELAERMSDAATKEESAAVRQSIKVLLDTTIDSGRLAEHWTRYLVRANSESIQDLVLIDKRTNTPVSHRDVGIGISQVLPVLVSAYALERSILAVEQPEIHLHPALQAELGDVFLDSALGSQQNAFLIETHSEHLLLRIMRRMRETSLGERSPDIPPVRPQDVTVLFVERDGAQSIVREMPLNERGELIKAWPGGFFEEDLREVF